MNIYAIILFREKSITANTNSVSSNNAVAQPLFEPTQANLGNATTKSKNNKVDIINRNRPSISTINNVKSNARTKIHSTNNVNSGKSHTDTFSDDKINALTCALVQLLRQFL